VFGQKVLDKVSDRTQRSTVLPQHLHLDVDVDPTRIMTLPTYLEGGESKRIRAETLLPFSNPRYEPPTIEEIRATLSYGSLTPNEAGVLMGVLGQTVESWCSGEHPIPYAAWRLLLISLRLVDGSGIDTVRVSQLE
jgi:hypothetical protein